MKARSKLTAFVLSVILTCTSLTAFSADTAAGRIGDSDHDGGITILDATRIQRTLAGLYSDADGWVAAFGDVDGGGLDITDATHIQRYIAGFPDPYGIGTIRSIAIPSPTDPPTSDPTVTPTQPPTESAGFTVSAYESQVATLINEIRADYGLNPLSLDTDLCRVARLKSQDMHDKGYFDHTSPTYGSPFDMMTAFGVRYYTAGENIAYGYRTPQAVVNGWMNSAGHRDNILNSSFRRIGVGYVADGSYWTQMFAG